MVLQVLLWGCLLGSVISRVVHQSDGIVSVITELEPDRTPVGYLQAVNRSPPASGPGRGVPVVVHTEPPPLEEGQFRVSSEKIQIVDSKTGLEVVNKAPVLVSDNKKEENSPSGEGVGQNEVKAESTDRKETYPEQKQTDGNRVGDSTFRVDSTSREGFPRKRKPGKYGYQSPRGDSVVRIDKTTKIREDDGPVQGYSHTIVRPINPREDFVTSRRKPGKPGHYVTFSPPTKKLNKNLDIDRNRRKNLNFEREKTYLDEPKRQKLEKEYSSKTVAKFPDGYAQGNERRTESSSKYRTGTSEKKNFRTPPKASLRTGNTGQFSGTYYPSSIYDKLEYDQSLKGANSLLDSSVRGVDGSFVDHGYPVREHYSGSIGGGYGGFRGGHGEGFGREKHFENAGGRDYVAAHNSAHGYKNEKQHRDDESFSKGQNEDYSHGGNKGYSDEKEDDKKAHLDKSSHFASGHGTSEGAKEQDFKKDKGHRKGHKKSGYRSVVHKDEYKNKEEFYDEEHDSGEEKQQGHKSHHHAEKAGGQDKKEHLDSGHREVHRGHEDRHEEGHGHNHQQGYHKDQGHSGHYQHEDDYGKKSGHKEGEFHGHSEYGGYYR